MGKKLTGSGKLVVFVPKHGVVIGLVVCVGWLAEPLGPLVVEVVGGVGSFVTGVGVGVDGGGVIVSGRSGAVAVALVSGSVTDVVTHVGR